MIIANAHSWNNRPFAWWRHFTATTRIPQDFAFLCKLGLLLSKPHWDYKIKMTSLCKWPIAGIYKGRIEILLHHECLSFSRCKDQDWDWKTKKKHQRHVIWFPCSLALTPFNKEEEYNCHRQERKRKQNKNVQDWKYGFLVFRQVDRWLTNTLTRLVSTNPLLVSANYTEHFDWNT